MQNHLSMFLHKHARDRYQRWNDIVAEVKAAMGPMVTRQVSPLLEQVGAPEVKHCVEWDVLGACMEREYADLQQPGFFNGLVGWYLSGRFPCGWGERDQAGRIRLHGPQDESGYEPSEPDWLKIVLANQEHVYHPNVKWPAVGTLLVF